MRVPRIKPPSQEEIVRNLVCEIELGVQWADATEDERECGRLRMEEIAAFPEMNVWPTHLPGKTRQ